MGTFTHSSPRQEESEAPMSASPSPTVLMVAILKLMLAASIASAQAPAAEYLSARNREAPFPYLIGGQRTWPICERTLPDGVRVHLTARVGKQVAAAGARLEFRGMTVAVLPGGR